MIKKNDPDDDTLRNETSIDAMVTLRDKDGNALPKEAGSQYNWKVYYCTPEKGKDTTESDVKKMLNNSVERLNVEGADPDQFAFRLILKPGEVLTKPTLDKTIIDRDIIHIIKCEYDLEDNDLLSFAEDLDRVGEYFEDPTRGSEVIRSYVRRVLGNRGF